MIAMMEIVLVHIKNWGYTISYGISFACLTILVAIMLWMRFWLRKQDLNEESIETRFGGVYEGLNPQKESLLYQEWFIFRRLMFAATAFYFMGKIFLSFMVLFYSSLLTFAVILQRLHDSKLGRVMELNNEAF